MGNQPSQMAYYDRVSKAVPEFRQFGPQQDFVAFESDRERKQFIECVLWVLSNNRPVPPPSPTDNTEYRLVFSRSDDDRLIASLLEVQGGVVQKKLEALGDGKDQADAFKALKNHVERRMNELLKTIPNALEAPTHDARPSSPALSEATTTTTIPADDPPEYNFGSRALGAQRKN